ncbi:MAG TPA: aminotransferase class III-fold pyridoxal phosphate-dependent enzyme, partial [Thermoplasmata archaeon]|nr:aminotransferase class III-fold pyridoxal phosphate-dependent enzyme [Thermoplasmata archaeon]
VVRAIARQAAALNTNTRYLHDNIIELAERLTATLPAPLRICFFVNSGSEANDLAMRMARAHTGRDEVLVLDGAYHGTTAADIGVSPYKFDGPGGAGAPATTRKVPMPDPYRGPHRTGEEYASHVRKALEESPERLAAFIAEPLLGVGGQVVPPSGFFDSAFKAVRAGGGVCIADEVQTGFGRVGSKWWAFELHDVVPDIVTMGKPMGNGHPIAAVVTTDEIAASFANGMEYFNTYGGNPVSCAAALAVLDAMERDRLREHALRVGEELTKRLRELQSSKPSIGDVRGHGLFLGVDLVRDRETKEPAGDEARMVIEALKEGGILLSRDGPGKNVLKIKPPLPFSMENAAELVDGLARSIP